MNLNDFEDFIEFTKKQIAILRSEEDEHFRIYKESYDKWKTCTLDYLSLNLNKQVKKFNDLLKQLSFSKSNNQSRPIQLILIDLKDTLLNIGNYSYFLYTRIRRDD